MKGNCLSAITEAFVKIRGKKQTTRESVTPVLCDVIIYDC